MAMNTASDRSTQPIGVYRGNITPIDRLLETEVGRKEMLDDLVEKLRQNSGKKNKQHYLFIGPRGIGKTHFLTLIEHAVTNDKQLNSLYTIIRFPEENNRLLSFADILLGIVEILGDVTEDNVWHELHQSLAETENDNDIIDAIEPRIRHYHKQTGKTLLILLENLDTLFREQFKREQDVHRLRNFLMDQPCSSLIGTSPVYFPGITDNKSPLYDFFDIQVIEDLSEEQAIEMIRKNLEWEGRTDIIGNFNKFIPKIQALHIMTGGNPRLIICLYELIAHDNLIDVKLQIQKLLDQISPFYQDRLKDLAPQERALLETMALMRQIPRTPANIAKHLRKPPPQVSSLLKRMTQAGYLTLSDNPHDKRSKLYKIKEGFFDLWLAMSESRVHRKKLGFLAEFFEIYYTDKLEREAKRKELWTKLEGQAEQPVEKENTFELLSYLSDLGDTPEQCQTKLELAIRKLKEQKGEEARSFLMEAMPLVSHNMMHQWIAAQAQQWLGSDIPLDIRKWLDDMIEYWRTQRSGDLEKAASIAYRLGMDLSGHGLHAIRIEILKEALKQTGPPKEKIQIYHEIAESQFMDGQPNDAFKSLENALSICQESKDKHGIAITLHQLGMIHQDQGDYEKAIEKYNQSMKISEELGNKHGIAITLHQLGMIHQDQGDYEKAIEKYNQSMKISEELGNKHGIAITLHQLGMIHQDQGDYEKAIEKYNQSMKISEELGNKLGIAYTLHQLGNIHYQQGDYEKAIEKYNQSMKISEELGDKSGIAITLGQIGRINEEKKDYKKALKNYLVSFSIFEYLKSPYMKLAAKDINNIKEKIGEETFKKYQDEIVKEVGGKENE